MSEVLPSIDERMMIPDLLRAAPHVRGVLDRFGLRGCGGPLGPHESLGFFAKAHEVPLESLLADVRACLEQSTPMPQAPATAGDAQLADTIYRPFFKSGIAVVLTLGAVWGAYLLLRIAWQGTFGAVSLHEVNAHGHAQIFGWVGLFVMGFAYQAFPRFKHTTLACPRLAYASLYFMLAGIVVRSLAEPLAAQAPALYWPAVGAAVIEVLAITMFAAIVLETWRRSGRPLAIYDYYILSALVWFVVQAVYEAVYLSATLGVGAEESLVALVAAWQAPLREMQIHGFALMMILGVSQRLLHHFYGFPAPHVSRSVVALALLNAAVLGEVAGLVLMRTVSHAWAGLWYASALLLAGTTVFLVSDWHLFAAPDEAESGRERSLKFLRAAYVWLFVSLALLVLIPVHQFVLLPAAAPASAAAQLGFSHAYYGALRHAITVGFISLMIVGVSSRVVPTLNGVDTRALSPLWGPFFLINAGCFLRVSLQIGTDFTPISFPLVGISGLLEVSGLAWWGVHLWRIMAARGASARPALRKNPEAPIVASHCVGDVLDADPALLDIFLKFGFTPLANASLRKTMAYTISIQAACRMMSVDATRLLTALNAERQRRAGGRRSLVVVDSSANDQPQSPRNPVEICRCCASREGAGGEQ